MLNGFQYPIETKATTERKALVKLVDKHWKEINQAGAIELLGEVIITTANN